MYLSCSQNDTCVIDGQCYAGGDVNPALTFEVCDPSKDKNAWSFNPGQEPMSAFE